MPAIRFPASAVPLLPLCKGHGDNYIFKTYADLIGFVAAYGYHLENEGWKPKPCPDFSDEVHPIGIEVFENRGIFINFLTMAIARRGASESVHDDNDVAKFIEQQAALGAEKLAVLIAQQPADQALFALSSALGAELLDAKI